MVFLQVHKIEQLEAGRTYESSSSSGCGLSRGGGDFLIVKALISRRRLPRDYSLKEFISAFTAKCGTVVVESLIVDR